MLRSSPVNGSLRRTLPGWGIVALMVLLVCHANAQRKPYYHEDLFGLRPRLADPVDSLTLSSTHPDKRFVAAHANVNEKVDDVLDSINRFNVTRKFIDGHTIQIYSGQNREEAMNTKKKMTIGDLSAVLEYNQPKFRVRVGYYYSRLEAHKDLTRLKRMFPQAILVPEKIIVR